VNTFNRHENKWSGRTTRGEEREDWRNQNPSRKNGGFNKPTLMKKKGLKWLKIMIMVMN
jgi:hypothetical protein